MAKASPKTESTAAEPVPAPEGEAATLGQFDSAVGAAIEEIAAVEVVEHEDVVAVEVVAAPRTVRARVLAFCALGKPNDVIEIEADQVETVGDVIDTDPAAVAYALSQRS